MITIYFKRLKDLREDNDFSQKEVASYLKITQQQYSLYEKGQRTLPIDLAIQLAVFYNVSLDYIVELTNEPKMSKSKNINKQVNINGNKNNINKIEIK